MTAWWQDFWRLPVPRRMLIGLLAAAVAFYTFICGLIVLFDRVGATEGHSVTAWVVSLAGLVVSATLALLLAAAMVCSQGATASADERRPSASPCSPSQPARLCCC